MTIFSKLYKRLHDQLRLWLLIIVPLYSPHLKEILFSLVLFILQSRELKRDPGDCLIYLRSHCFPTANIFQSPDYWSTYLQEISLIPISMILEAKLALGRGIAALLIGKPRKIISQLSKNLVTLTTVKWTSRCQKNRKNISRKHKRPSMLSSIGSFWRIQILKQILWLSYSQVL